jgi:hypothetical protein
MVKSDEQMARIKDRLMYEQQQIDQSAERCVRGLSTSCIFGRVAQHVEVLKQHAIMR